MEAIAEVFSEVQESTSVSSKQVYTLLEQYEQNKNVFLKAMEQCYLKIIKNMLKSPRKLIEKYEKLTEKLFETGYRSYAVKEDQSSKKQKLTKRDIYALFQHFLAFFAGALDSTQLQIRIFSSRIVFQILKILPSDILFEVLETKVAKQLISGTLSLMKEKKGNLKQIGIKITSYLQKLMDRDDLTETQEAKVLRGEMMRSMCMDDQDQIRKLALINLEMNENTFPHLIKRIRDKNPEIRATVFKKLIKEQIPLANLNLSDIYKLIYDGLGSRESAVRDACTRYLSLNYCLFKEEGEEKAQRDEEMEIEEAKEKDGDEDGSQDHDMDEQKSKRKQTKSTIKRFFTPNKETAMKDMKIKILNFLKTFEIEKSLYYPELYESLEVLIKETIKCILDADSFSAYLKDCFINQLSLKKKKKHSQISLESEELFLIRILCQMVSNEDERKELSPELVAVVEDCFPNGVDFSSVIDYYAFSHPNLFSLYQVLLLAGLLINCDESGRNKIEETLKNLVINMNNMNLISEIPTDPSDEYNDIFYELDADCVKNNIFAQSYFQSPIITCSYELLPIIVNILKKVVSDGRVNVQLIQLISEVHEPLAKDADNDSHFDLPTELERIQRTIKEETAKLELREKELQNLKKNKTKQNEIYLLEKEKDEKQAHLKIWQEKEEAIQLKIFDVSMRQLILVQALLSNCKVDPKDHAITNLLQQIIMPGLHSTNYNLNYHSLKTLALYVLIDKKNCIDFFSVFSEILDKNEGCQNCSPQEIISLRSIVDFLLLYDLSQKSSQDDEDIDIPQTQELILKYAYQSDILLRTLAIEGLSKLLFNGKLQDAHSTICLLMVIWFDTKICQKEGFKAVQILSTLFKTYTASNFSHLQTFEKALELFTLLIVTLDKKGLVFNDEYVIFDHLNEKFISKALRVGINLMSYEYHKNTEALNNPPSNEFPPQERFFLYLAYKCSKDRRFISHFEKVTQFFDFYNRCTQDQLQIVLHFLKEAIENCPISKQLNTLEKLIKDKIKIQDKKERIEEEDEIRKDDVAANDKADGQEGAAATVNGEGNENSDKKIQDEDDERLFTLNARQKKVCEKISELFEGNQQDVEIIIKNLCANKTLIQDSVEQKAKRAQVSDDEEEDDRAIPEEDQEDEENKPKRGKPSKRKANQPNSDEEDQEVEGESQDAEQTQIKRKGRQQKKDISATAPQQKGKKKKEISRDTDQESDQEENQEEAKKTSASRKDKKSKEAEEILSNETEVDDEEVTSKRTSTRIAQKLTVQSETAPNQKQKRDRKKKTEEKDEEDMEENDESEDEEAEDKKNKKSQGRRGRNSGSKTSSTEKENPNPKNRRLKKNNSNEDEKMNEESEERKASDDEEDQDSQEQDKRRKRGGRNVNNLKQKSNEKKKSKDTEEEVEDEKLKRTRGSSKQDTPQQKKGKSTSSEKPVQKEDDSDSQSDEDNGEDAEKPVRGKKPKAQTSQAVKTTKSTRGRKQQNENEQSQSENEESEDEEDEGEQTKSSRGRRQKSTSGAKGKGQAKKQTTKVRGNSRNKMDQEDESESSEEEIDEEEQQPKTRGRGKNAAANKQQTNVKGKRNKSQNQVSENSSDEDEEDDEEEESAPQRTTRRQQQAQKVVAQTANKKPVASSQRARKNK